MENKTRLIKDKLIKIVDQVVIRTFNSIYIGTVEHFHPNNIWLNSAAIKYENITEVKIIGEK